jgi:hypothetical protein
MILGSATELNIINGAFSQDFHVLYDVNVKISKENVPTSHLPI